MMNGHSGPRSNARLTLLVSKGAKLAGDDVEVANWQQYVDCIHAT